MRALITAAVITSAVAANGSPPGAAGRLPSEHQVLTFIGDTIDWYRHLPTFQRIGSEPADLFFLENNRPTAMEIVRLSFRFGKAVAAIEAPENTRHEAEQRPGSPVDKELAFLLSVKNKLAANEQLSDDELRSLIQGRLRLRSADPKMDTEVGEMRTRIQVLSTISANYQNLADFVRNSTVDSDPDDNLAALVEDLERTVPEVSVDGSAPRPPNIPEDPPRTDYGIMGRISRVSAIARKEHYIETAIERTNALMKASQHLRSPFRETLLNQLASFSGDEQSLNVLKKQQTVLAGLVSQLETVSPAVSALIKQDTLLNLYRLRLTEWHSDVQLQYQAAWRAVFIRLGILAAAIVTLSGISVVVRRVISARARGQEARNTLLLSERLLFWAIVIAVVLFAFAFDPRSLATFLGLLSAGLAVGAHDVLLAIGGRMLLARRFHMRLGQRIEIAGVRGEVTKLGLMEFALNEIDADGRETGREVFFANSYVFVSPATPLFRHMNAPALGGSKE